MCSPVGLGARPGTLALLYRIDMIFEHEAFSILDRVRNRMMKKRLGRSSSASSGHNLHLEPNSAKKPSVFELISKARFF